MRTRSLAIGLAIVSLCSAPASAEPSVPGFTVEEYAAVPLPMRLSFDETGALFVGNNVQYPTPGPITRVGPGGAPVAPYGPDLLDPDAVIAYDPNGLVPGANGAVFAGGVHAVESGYVVEILPDETGQPLWGPGPALENPQDFEYDSQGRLVIVDYYTDHVHVSTGGVPTALFSVPGQPSALAIDALDNIAVLSVDGVVRTYDATGTLLNGAFATGLGGNPGLAYGPGGIWGTDLYTISDGELRRFDAAGNETVLGTGFSVGDDAVTDVLFGPDGALYASDYPLERILRIAPETVDVSPAPPVANGSRLFQNSPNPFTPRTRIAFVLGQRGFVELDVFDVAGRHVRRLLASDLAAGRRALSWSGDDRHGKPLSSGQYFYRLRVDGEVVETRSALVRR